LEARGVVLEGDDLRDLSVLKSDDSGFLIALKGFVGTVIAGMASFPLAVLGAIVVGIVESFSSFYASAFKEAIVFALLIPFLLWRSAVEPRSHETHEHDE